MARNSNNIFASEEYLLLCWLSNHQMETNSSPIIQFSQNDLAKELKCSPTTVNKRMKALQKAKCVEPYNKRGNYRITEIGCHVISMMNEISSITGGNNL